MNIKLKVICAFGLFALASCGGSQSVPDQRALDICSERVGLKQKLTVVTGTNGQRTVTVEPAGSTVPVNDAIALKNCTDSL